LINSKPHKFKLGESPSILWCEYCGTVIEVWRSKKGIKEASEKAQREGCPLSPEISLK